MLPRASVLILLALRACEMPAKKRPAAGTSDLQADSVLFPKLADCGTKVGLVEAIGSLSEAGWLRPEVVEGLEKRSVRARLSQAIRKHCDADTPYGKVVQSMPLESEQLPSWEYAHPLALMYHLSCISAIFSDLMAQIIVPGSPLRIVLYVDEICPGNPLRPDKSRTLQAIYWAILEWPQHVLQRTAAWPVFGTIRSKIVKDLPGDLSGLMKKVLEVFFNATGHAFNRGVQIVVRGRENLLATGRFAGFLADDKAHNQIGNQKGASATKCCINCNNVYNRVHDSALVAGAVGIHCTEMSDLRMNTDADIYTFYDHLAEQRDHMGDREFERLSQRIGINLNPDGLLACLVMRQVYLPVTHMIRDWMHMLVSNGVANVQCARVLHYLKRNNVTLATVADFIGQFTLPQRLGRVDKAWVSTKRLGQAFKSLTAFSGDMLSLLPILECFLLYQDDRIAGLHPHVICFQQLCAIVGILSLGPDDMVPYVDRLAALLAQHGRLFVQLYRAHVKPKFHHLRHLPDTIRLLQKCVSCFVTERKHRTTKRMALFTFRAIDNTVVKKMINKQCEQLSGSSSLFCKTALAKPRQIQFGPTVVLQAMEALLPSGNVRVRDIVVLRSGEAGMVKSFWGFGNNIVVQLETCPRLSPTTWAVADGGTTVVSVDDIVDAAAYATASPGVLRVLAPTRVKLELA